MLGRSASLDRIRTYGEELIAVKLVAAELEAVIGWAGAGWVDGTLPG